MSKIFRGEKTNTDPVPAYILNFQAGYINSQVEGKCLHFQWVVCTTTSPFTGDTGSENESFIEVKFFLPLLFNRHNSTCCSMTQALPQLKEMTICTSFLLFFKLFVLRLKCFNYCFKSWGKPK